MKILGIETSCDETAAAVVEGLAIRGQVSGVRVLSNVVASQMKIHAKTGGVVPEVAARAHVEKIIPVVQRALVHAGMQYNTFARTSKSVIHRAAQEVRGGKGIDVIAVTTGPGLMTSLLVGVEVARTLSFLWKKPLIAVNHLAGHVYANWLPPPSSSSTRGEETIAIPHPSVGWVRGGGQIQFPLLCLIVSGGHTELVLMRRHLDFQVIGATRDDAAGEAFDKVAKMLGLGYPGGPAVAAEAEKYTTQHVIPDRDRGSRQSLDSRFRGNDKIVEFPRPMIDSPDFDFSFSGLKTAVLYYLKNLPQQNNVRPHIKMLRAICHEFQEAAVEVLVAKTIRAAKQYKVKTVLLGGGVAANQRLRERLVNTVNYELKTVNCILPQAEYTTDNAAMIAAAGYFMARAKQYTPWQKLDVDPNWELGEKMQNMIR